MIFSLKKECSEVICSFTNSEIFMSSIEVDYEVKQGMLDACRFHFMQKESYDSDIKPEYLSTASIGINLTQKLFNSDYKVCMEQPTGELAKSCFPLLQEGQRKWSPRITDFSEIKISRPGYVDIAILNKINGLEQGDFVIEVKNIAPQKSLLKEDLLRNKEFLTIKTDNLSSLMKGTISAFYVSGKGIKCESQKNEFIKEVKPLYEQLSDEYISDQFDIKVDVFDAGSYLADDSKKLSQNEIEDASEYSYCILGVLIKFLKKGKTFSLQC
jgi:hypothetical protein